MINDGKFLRNSTLHEAEIQSDQMNLRENVERWRDVKRFSPIKWDEVKVKLELWSGNELYELLKTKTHIHEGSIVGNYLRLSDETTRPPRIWNGYPVIMNIDSEWIILDDLHRVLHWELDRNYGVLVIYYNSETKKS